MLSIKSFSFYTMILTFQLSFKFFKLFRLKKLNFYCVYFNIEKNKKLKNTIRTLFNEFIYW